MNIRMIQLIDGILTFGSYAACVMGIIFCLVIFMLFAIIKHSKGFQKANHSTAMRIGFDLFLYLPLCLSAGLVYLMFRI